MNDIQNSHKVLRVLKKFVFWALIVLTLVMICISAFLSMFVSWDVDFASYASDFYTVERCMHREFGKNVEHEDEYSVKIKTSNEIYVKSIEKDEEKDINFKEGEREAFERIRKAFTYKNRDHEVLIHVRSNNTIDFYIPEIGGTHRLVYSPDPLLIEVSKGYIKYAVFPVGFNWYYLEEGMQIVATAFLITAVLVAADIVLICIKLYKKRRKKSLPVSDSISDTQLP